MATPGWIQALIAMLANDIYNLHASAAGAIPDVAWDEEMARMGAEYQARLLLRKGWRKVDSTALPSCPHGTPACFDAEPHAECWMP